MRCIDGRIHVDIGPALLRKLCAEREEIPVHGHAGLPEIDFNGVIENLGATAFSVPRGRVSETFQVLDNYTWTRGHHTLKFGGEFHRYDVQSFNDNLERGLLDVSPPGIAPDPIVAAAALPRRSRGSAR